MAKKDPKKSEKKETANVPVYKARSNSVTVAVWKHVNEDKVSYSSVLQKSYKDDDEEWHNTDTLFPSDLPHARKALDMAHTWIIEQYQSTED